MCEFLRSEMGFTVVDTKPETSHVGSYASCCIKLCGEEVGAAPNGKYGCGT